MKIRLGLLAAALWMSFSGYAFTTDSKSKDTRDPLRIELCDAGKKINKRIGTFLYSYENYTGSENWFAEVRGIATLIDSEFKIFLALERTLGLWEKADAQIQNTFFEILEKNRSLKIQITSSPMIDLLALSWGENAELRVLQRQVRELMDQTCLDPLY